MVASTGCIDRPAHCRTTTVMMVMMMIMTTVMIVVMMGYEC